MQHKIEQLHEGTQRSSILPVRGVPVGESPLDQGSFLWLSCSLPGAKAPRLPALPDATGERPGGRNLAEKADAYF